MTTSQPIDIDAIESAWSALCDHSDVYQDVRATVKRAVNEECARQINAGNYDSAASLRVVYDVFAREHLFDEACVDGGNPDIDQLLSDIDRPLVDEQSGLVDVSIDEQRELLDDDSAFVSSVLENDAFFETQRYGWNEVTHAIFQRLVEELESEDELLYVYNRQQVRSHVAEMTRYFALLRQRLPKDTPYEFEPNLVKMVKMASADREQPIMDDSAEESARLWSPIRRILDRVSAEDVEPAWELHDRQGSDWSNVIEDALTTFGEFLEEGLGFDALAQYQADAFYDVYLDAVTEGDDSTSHVITASTGGGKTEAFLFPTLAYCLTASIAGIDGSTAVLTYPRRDLCDNQFERAFEYITELNRLRGGLDRGFEESDLTISLQHGARNDIELDCPHCSADLTPADGRWNTHFTCSGAESHEIRYASTDRSDPADVIITTQGSLHRRIMDNYGRDAFWEQSYPPKFLVLDEVHIYSDQAGMNVANVVRRFKQALSHRAGNQSPTLVASSATIEEEKDFTRRIFGTDSANHISPAEEEKRTTSREHFIFVKATDPRDVTVPVGDSKFKPRDEWDEVEHTTAANISCMIQIAFAFQHTMRKEGSGSRPELNDDKDRVLGFVDSIDSVSRLAGYVQDAEERGLYEFRQPDALLGTRDNNPDCPRSQFRGGTDDEYNEEAVCESLPPNPNHAQCEVYEDGECWWSMQDHQLDLEQMTVAKHKSGRTEQADGTNLTEDEWDQLISTSALEVGFDHANVIGTFQYRAPRTVPGFIQRKGRGGRDAGDEPITVVVLGSSPTDAYYFHHSNVLSDPDDEYLEIPLDEQNRFVRASHMTSAILDYFNVREGVDADRIFSGDDGNGPDVDYLQRTFGTHRQDIERWLRRGFEAEPEEVTQVLDEFGSYLASLDEPVVSSDGEVPFWEFFRQAIEEAGGSGSYQPVDNLIDHFEEQHD